MKPPLVNTTAVNGGLLTSDMYNPYAGPGAGCGGADWLNREISSRRRQLAALEQTSQIEPRVSAAAAI